MGFRHKLFLSFACALSKGAGQAASFELRANEQLRFDEQKVPKQSRSTRRLESNSAAFPSALRTLAGHRSVLRPLTSLPRCCCC